MLFIGGVQPKRAQVEPNPRRCPRCGREAARLERIDHYLSLFFIPLIPVSRGEPYLACDNCGYTGPAEGEAVPQEPWSGGPEVEPRSDEESEELRCSRCGARLRPEYRYCPICGRELR